MSQRHKVLSLLRHAGEKGVTNAEFLDWRIPRFSARICELREDDYEITTEAEHNSRVRYTLVSEPDVEGDRGGVSEGIPPLSEPGTSTVALDARRARYRRMSARESIQPTYDHRDTGDRYTITIWECDRTLSTTAITDPFVTQRVHVRGWRNALRVLLRRYTICVTVGGDHSIIEDVMELNNDYKGEPGSSRRAEWDSQLQGALHDFAARAGEHDIS